MLFTEAPAAPTTTVLPLVETEKPKKSPALPSFAVSLAVWGVFVQLEPFSVNT